MIKDTQISWWNNTKREKERDICIAESTTLKPILSILFLIACYDFLQWQLVHRQAACRKYHRLSQKDTNIRITLPESGVCLWLFLFFQSFTSIFIHFSFSFSHRKNKIKDRDCVIFAEIFLYLPLLKNLHLYLACNQISDEGIEALTEKLSVSEAIT